MDASRLVAIALAIVCFSFGAAEAQQCTNDSFSIVYDGSTAFSVSTTDATCSCAGPVYSLSGVSQLRTLSVENLFVTNSSAGVRDPSCQAQIAQASLQIAQLNASFYATVLGLQQQIAALSSCSGGGGGGGGGGGSFCSVTAPTDGGVVGSPTRVLSGQAVRYFCNAGYVLNGYADQTCVAGEFDHAAPTCPAGPCNVTTPANGGISPGSLVASGTSVTYTCSSGYSLVGSATRTCVAGVLSGTAPACQGLPCTAVAPANGAVSATTVPHGTSVTYSCTGPNYYLNGTSTRTCSGGVLSGTQPNCMTGCTPTGARQNFNAALTGQWTTTGCFTSTAICGRQTYSWDGGRLFRMAGEEMVCGAPAPTCIRTVGITTYDYPLACQGVWEVYCDTTLMGQINTALGSGICTGDAMTNGCSVSMAQAKLCTTIKLRSVSGRNPGSCCGGSYGTGFVDTTITGVSAW